MPARRLAQTVSASLARYEPERLASEMSGGQTSFSRLLEFLCVLINGEWQPMPLPRAPLNEVLATTRPVFGTEAMEYRCRARPGSAPSSASRSTRRRPSSACSIALLSAPFPFVLTQSFTFLTKAAGQALLQRQYQPHGQRRRLCGLAGRGAEGGARCADEQRVRDGRPSLLAAGAGR